MQINCKIVLHEGELTMKKSSFKAFVGLVGGLLGFYLLFSAIIQGVFFGLILAFVDFIGYDLPLILITIPIISFVIGIILIKIAFKLFFENETNFWRRILGIIGIIAFLVGIAILIFTALNLFGLVGVVLLLSFGVACIGYGFNDVKYLKVLKPAGAIIEIFKRVVSANIIK